ncbi:hypothetical protein WA026_007910 [Henosepilachna vigintioctopunctata]|uniref:WAP domain-containing protein n=1 Tax=Henosepilachna vigintioctopunctata TaxID=420089 RepID=A0AAW1U3L6_9CUCU
MINTVLKFGLISWVVAVSCEKTPYASVSKISGPESGEKIVWIESNNNNPVKRSIAQHSALACPGKEVRIPFFALPCGENQDCSIVGPNMVCCSYRCIKGVFPTTQQNIQDPTIKILPNAISTPSLPTNPPITTSSTSTTSTTSAPTTKAITTTTTPATTTTTKTTPQAIIAPTSVAVSVQTPENAPQNLLLVCPERVWIAFFSLPCANNHECSSSGPNMICCSYRCVEGILQYPPKIVIKGAEGVEIKRNDLSNVVITDPPTTKPTTPKSLEVVAKSPVLVCPEKEPRITLFSLSCETNKDCAIMGNKMVCCLKRCIKGVLTIEVDQKQALSSNNVYLVKQNYEQNSTTAYNTNTLTATSTPPLKVSVANIHQQKTLLACPNRVIRIPFLAIPCKTHQECSDIGKSLVCCFSQCVVGVSAAHLDVQKTLTVQTAPASTTIKNAATISTSANSLTNPIPNQQAKASSVNPSPHPAQQPPSLICPGNEVRIPFFSVPCRTNEECSRINVKMVCCSSRCIAGVPPPKPEIKHQPSWFGLVERVCPADPIAEILEIKECQSDADCTPRICCPDKYRNGSGDNKNYCRTAQPILDRLPAANRWSEPLRAVASYMQCTPPPPPVLDLFPKSCNNTLDCFPNLCCQEGGKKYCRPPKRSLLSFVAGVGQRLVPADAAKRIIERLN